MHVHEPGQTVVHLPQGQDQASPGLRISLGADGLQQFQAICRQLHLRATLTLHVPSAVHAENAPANRVGGDTGP